MLQRVVPNTWSTLAEPSYTHGLCLCSSPASRKCCHHSGLIMLALFVTAQMRWQACGIVISKSTHGMTIYCNAKPGCIALCWPRNVAGTLNSSIATFGTSNDRPLYSYTCITYRRRFTPMIYSKVHAHHAKSDVLHLVHVPCHTESKNASSKNSVRKVLKYSLEKASQCGKLHEHMFQQASSGGP